MRVYRFQPRPPKLEVAARVLELSSMDSFLGDDDIESSLPDSVLKDLLLEVRLVLILS